MEEVPNVQDKLGNLDPPQIPLDLPNVQGKLVNLDPAQTLLDLHLNLEEWLNDQGKVQVWQVCHYKLGL